MQKNGTKNFQSVGKRTVANGSEQALLSPSDTVIGVQIICESAHQLITVFRRRGRLSGNHDRIVALIITLALVAELTLSLAGTAESDSRHSALSTSATWITTPEETAL